jgi:hypothetical protein
MHAEGWLILRLDKAHVVRHLKKGTADPTQCPLLEVTAQCHWAHLG